MHEYRVAKYDPQYRVNGAYTRDEWTSISDVGRSYDGSIFTIGEYERVEQHYVEFLCELAEICGAFPLRVDAYDEHYGNKTWCEGQEIRRTELPDIARSILREEGWCRLIGKEFFIHFGYDYYMYVGCDRSAKYVSALAAENYLFCEKCRSPYHDEEEES